MKGQRGIALVQLLVVALLVAIMLLIALPNFQRYLRKQRQVVAASTIRGFVGNAHWNALKEKVTYRVLLHDENSLTPDLVEFQKRQSGTYVTLPGGRYHLPKNVHILSTAPSDSIDAITVNSRGECRSGKVFVGENHEYQQVVSIERTCKTSLL